MDEKAGIYDQETVSCHQHQSDIELDRLDSISIVSRRANDFDTGSAPLTFPGSNLDFKHIDDVYASSLH
jgi:hypothetical protein